MPRRVWWLTPLLALAFILPLLAEQPPAGAGDDDDSFYVRRRKPGRCLCSEGQGTYEYLRAPMRAPADPPRCGLQIAKGDCGSKPKPKGASGTCWSSQKKECFFKRHGYSWDLKCSECFADDECEGCNDLLPDAKWKETLTRQLKLEGHDGKRRSFVLVISPHFYVLTDIHRKLKVKTDGGAPRVIDAHELAHLYAARCERAYNDWCHWFKDKPGMPNPQRPMAVYLMRQQRTAEAIAEAYLGSARTDMIYGGSNTSRIAKGYCGNGFVGSLQESGDDEGLHSYCRHMIGHILFSCWIKVNGQEKYCPKWAFIGSAHFLEKLLEPHKDQAHYCSQETTAPSGPGKDWDKRARNLASRKLDPIETFFARDSLGAFSYKDHIRTWSLMDLGLREDQDRWLAALRLLRYGNDEGYALQEGLGMSPDAFNQRWIDRLTGRRPTMGEMRKDAGDDDEPGRRERERIRTTEDADNLAGLIRGLHSIKDVRTLKEVLNRLDHESDLVREAVQIVLERTTDDEVREALRTDGLDHRKKMARAGVARALGTLRDALARERLEALLEDGFWLARANAAWALSQIADKASLPKIQAALDERQPKAWISMVDAFASFGERSKEATLLVAPKLSHSAWQVRLTACQGLATFGTAECMEPLIDRFEMEKGRMEKELRAALKAVSGDDLGARATTWRKWWKSQLEQHGGFDPNAPPMPENPEDDRYAQPDAPDDAPHYYGRRIYSRGVGFVFDTSGSMDKNITIPEGTTALGDIPRTGTRMQIAKEVLAQAILKLHPQTKFNLVFFSTEVRPWKKRMVPAGSNGKSAASAVMNAPAAGETNIHGALKAALGLHEKPSLNAVLDDIPDTVYFLTDGSPTRGEITATPELMGWFADINRFGKVQLHVVAFGNLGVDLDFLRGLANVGGGDFIHVPEK